LIDKPQSILHVLAPANVGGLETVVRTLARGLAPKGHSVEIAAVLDVATNTFVEEARESGLTVHVINSPARSFIPERRALRALLAGKSIDVVHSHGSRSDILDIGVARSVNVPSVTTLHGFSATALKARTYEWLQTRGARRASAIVAVSTGVADKLIRNGASPTLVHVIRNAMSSASRTVDRVEARQRLGLGDGQQIGWIGRLSSEKGPDVMLAAMAQLTNLDTNLSFLGDGPDLARLTQRAEEMGIADRVRFHGRVPGAASLLRAFDVIALSSRTEGTPMVILEAMSRRVPIVATLVGGIPDTLSPAEALLVPPDDPSALASAITSALADSASSATRASRAHQRLITEFDVDAWLAKYETLYRSIQPAIRNASR